MIFAGENRMISKKNVWSTRYLQAIVAKGGQFLEAPVSGSKQPAETGQLIILAAGEKVELIFVLCMYPK